MKSYSVMRYTLRQAVPAWVTRPREKILQPNAPPPLRQALPAWVTRPREKIQLARILILGSEASVRAMPLLAHTPWKAARRPVHSLARRPARAMLHCL